MSKPQGVGGCVFHASLQTAKTPPMATTIRRTSAMTAYRVENSSGTVCNNETKHLTPHVNLK